MKITTNNCPRDLLTFHDIPAKEQPDFDYVEGDDQFSPRFFCYRGSWYDSHEFMRAPADLTPWQGVQSDTYFSGTLLRYTEDFEQVITGRYFS